MVARRLAPNDIQPPTFAFTAENGAWAQREIQKYPPGRQMSAVIPLLWRAQEQAGGWLPQKAIEFVAERLGMAYIRVLEVATFYTMFNLEPIGRHFVQLCGTVPCHVKGALELKEVLRRRIGDERHVTKDGLFSWLEVECLGACCNAPMVQINADYYEDLTPEILEKMLDDLAGGSRCRYDDRNGAVRTETREARCGPGHRARGCRHAGEAGQGRRANPGPRRPAEGVGPIAGDPRRTERAARGEAEPA